MKARRYKATCRIIAPAKPSPAQNGGQEVKEALKIRSLTCCALSVCHKGNQRVQGREISSPFVCAPSFIEPVLNFILIYKSRGKNVERKKKDNASIGTWRSLAGGSENMCPLGC